MVLKTNPKRFLYSTISNSRLFSSFLKSFALDSFFLVCAPQAKFLFLWGSFYGFRPIDFHKFYGGGALLKLLQLLEVKQALK